MKISVLKLLPVAAAFSLSVGVMGNAHAQAYAVAYNNIFDFTVAQSPALSAQFIFPNTTVSKDSITLTGFTGKAGSAALDAPGLNLGDSAKANNDFTLRGNTGGSYARADNWIASEQVAIPGTSAQVLGITETRILGGGTATGTSDTGSDTVFSIPFVVSGPTTLTFDFKADPYLQVIMDPDVLAPSVARAGLSASITIQDAVGNTVFSWAPNGTLNNISGGTVIDAGVNLNTQISRNFAFTGETTYDPTGNGAADVGNLTPATFASFNAITNALGSGQYILTLRIAEFSEVQRVPVPEPATLALLGLGLAGVGFMRRGKQV